MGPARVMDDNEGFEGRCGDSRRTRCCLVLGRSLRNASFLLTLTHKCCTDFVLSLFIGNTLLTSVSKCVLEREGHDLQIPCNRRNISQKSIDVILN